ncbi:hypothetical protein GGR88_002407 [Sphingomonas jejuensis]|uniref:Uncharacterized protein n=1 Tax=Sphingomonas jejuensis TaxID=904715 RepID=A0ABX0XND2_9SPHN|nr:hypothetical protein [Sphingomonas jejuensis]NJC34893.1 hypothetical protein [Sphingomonas jejuensis]
MRSFIRSTGRFLRSDLFRNFAGGFVVGGVALVGLAGKAEAATALFL